MEKTGYIYKITNPSNKIYIGKTVCLNARISNYRRCNGIKEQKISQSNKGKLRSKLTTEKINQTKLLNLIKKHECILQIDKATNKIIKEWITLPKFISNELGICSSNIAKCLNHKKPHAVGYIWRYKK